MCFFDHWWKWICGWPTPVLSPEFAPETESTAFGRSQAFFTALRVARRIACSTCLCGIVIGRWMA